MKPEDIELIQTCEACPEQYDAYFRGEKVGYLRLRHGSFTVDYEKGGLDENVLRGSPRGDGVFDDDERETWLTAAKLALCQRFYRDPGRNYTKTIDGWRAAVADDQTVEGFADWISE